MIHQWSIKIYIHARTYNIITLLFRARIHDVCERVCVTTGRRRRRV